MGVLLLALAFNTFYLPQHHASGMSSPPNKSHVERLERMENEVAQLKKIVEELKTQIDQGNGARDEMLASILDVEYQVKLLVSEKTGVAPVIEPVRPLPSKEAAQLFAWQPLII